MTQYLGSGKKKKSLGRIFVPILALGGLGGLIAAGVFAFRAGAVPVVSLEADKKAIGKRTVFVVRASEPKRGLTALKVHLDQNGQSRLLAEQSFAPKSPFGTGPSTTQRDVEVVVGRDSIEGLVEGEATVRVSAYGAGSLFKDTPVQTAQVTLPVRLRPPTLEVRSSHIYPAQGGCEAVVYVVGPTATRHGVQAGDWFFPGYPLKGGEPGEQFALFSVPYDMGNADDVKLVASDEVDNRLALPFVDRFTPRPFATDTIRVSERVMKRVVPKIMAQVPSFKSTGDLVKDYVAINSVMRKANNSVLEQLAKNTKADFLWDRSFVQMSAKAVSQFADRRTYYHQDKKIDQQDHLGFDLASTRRAPIPAANSGVVLYADYLGIYGDAVVIDHGYGLMSLYGHLSEISVKKGDTVTRAQTIGRTGATGLALGDHLHFTMMLHGLPVTPLEWWDGHWIQDRLANKLGASLNYKSGETDK